MKYTKYKFVIEGEFDVDSVLPVEINYLSRYIEKRVKPDIPAEPLRYVHCTRVDVQKIGDEEK